MIANRADVYFIISLLLKLLEICSLNSRCSKYKIPFLIYLSCIVYIFNSRMV